MRWGDRIWEVVSVDALEGAAVRYVLAPWPDHSAIRVIATYDAAAEDRRISERRSDTTGVFLRPGVALLSPLLGHLPAPAQKRIEARYAVSGVAMTVVSAAPLLLAGLAGGLSAIAGAFGAPPLFSWTPGPLLSAYLVVESSVRVFQAWIQGEPMGSLPGFLLWRLAHVRAPAAAAPEAGRAGEIGRAAHDPVGDPERDRFSILEPLWSLLRPEEQDRLRDRFGFEALRWGRVTAATLFAVGAANVLASAAALAGGLAGALDVIWLAAGLALCAEQVVRWRENRNGRPRGSVLGWIVRPLARRLLSNRPN